MKNHNRGAKPVFDHRKSISAAEIVRRIARLMPWLALAVAPAAFAGFLMSTAQVNQSTSQVRQSTAQVDQSTSQTLQSTSQVTQITAQVNQSTAQITQSTSQQRQSASQLTRSTSQLNQSTAQITRSTLQHLQSTSPRKRGRRYYPFQQSVFMDPLVCQHAVAPRLTRSFHQSTCIFPFFPMNGESFGNDMPLARRIARTVVGTHAGAFAFDSNSVPTGGRTPLVSLKRLDYIGSPKAAKRSPDNIFEPRFRCEPTFVFVIPLGNSAMLSANPVAMRVCIGEHCGLG